MIIASRLFNSSSVSKRLLLNNTCVLWYFNVVLIKFPPSNLLIMHPHTPLWIFGYGSLIWKADFPYTEKLNGFIKGYIRRFYQCSVDHRGIASKPGRVVTLIPSNDPEAKVWGVAYKVSEKDRESVLKHLDYREKGGYEKVIIQFYPTDKLWSGGSSVDSVTYFASESNQYFAGEADIDSIAEQIINSYGISGSNKEYVYKLAESMRSIAPDVDDPHLFALETAVKKLDTPVINL